MSTAETERDAITPIILGTEVGPYTDYTPDGYIEEVLKSLEPYQPYPQLTKRESE